MTVNFELTIFVHLTNNIERKINYLVLNKLYLTIKLVLNFNVFFIDSVLE